jgi:mono/diheme cytochrome c family protein
MKGMTLMKKQLLLCLCFVLTAGSVTAASSNEEPKSRGQLLYENHCIGCHTSSVNSRNPRKAHNLDDLSRWVAKWAKAQNLTWNKDEISDVVDYLNQEYYHLNK